MFLMLDNILENVCGRGVRGGSCQSYCSEVPSSDTKLLFQKLTFANRATKNKGYICSNQY